MTPYFISGLRNEFADDSFFRYFANAKDGDGAVLTYSFLTSVPQGTPTLYGDPSLSFSQYSDAEKATIRQVLDIFETYIDIDFQEDTGATDLRFGIFDIKDNIAGYADYPQFVKADGDLAHGADKGEVWFDTGSIEGNLFLAMHEIGHALGLEHPFEGAFQLGAENNTDNTVMSYTQGQFMPTSLQLFDIIALQSIYGPAQLRTGDDIYHFGEDKLIWDGGGKDTVTAKRADAGVTIDITDGSWNHLGAKSTSLLDAGQVYLGNFTLIENLTGSNFDDVLSGNRMANTIIGGTGADRMTGGKGSDTFIFARITDSTTISAGRDTIDGFSRQQHDDIDLSRLDADSGHKRNQEFTFIGTERFSGDAGELRYQDKAGDTLISGDIDGNGKADFAIMLDGDINLVKGDFML